MIELTNARWLVKGHREVTHRCTQGGGCLGSSWTPSHRVRGELALFRHKRHFFLSHYIIILCETQRTDERRYPPSGTFARKSERLGSRATGRSRKPIGDRWSGDRCRSFGSGNRRSTYRSAGEFLTYRNSLRSSRSSSSRTASGSYVQSVGTKSLR